MTNFEKAISEKESKHTKKDLKKPIEQRMTFEIDGESRRLEWIAQNKPEFFIRYLCHGDWGHFPAILSALAKAGWDMPRIIKEATEHPEWEADPAILSQV